MALSRCMAERGRAGRICGLLVSNRSIVDEFLSGEQGLGEAEIPEIADAHRIQDPEEVIDFVLHDARMEPADGAVDRFAVLIETAITQARVARYEAAHARHR